MSDADWKPTCLLHLPAIAAARLPGPPEGGPTDFEFSIQDLFEIEARPTVALLSFELHKHFFPGVVACGRAIDEKSADNYKKYAMRLRNSVHDPLMNPVLVPCCVVMSVGGQELE